MTACIMSAAQGGEFYPELIWFMASNGHPGEGLHPCSVCKFYFRTVNMSKLKLDRCRFCLPHCAVCTSTKNLNNHRRVEYSDVLCRGCQGRVMRTCDMCHVVFRDWMNTQTDRCEACKKRDNKPPLNQQPPAPPAPGIDGMDGGNNTQ